MQPKLPASLQPIYDLELSLGNQVDRVRESPHAALPLAVIFKNPIHRADVELKIDIVSPIKWYAVGGFAGYVSEDTRESLQGPIPAVAVITQIARQKLSSNLQPIYDLELLLGNTVVRVDEPAGSLCPLAIIFRNPLHKAEVESTLPRAAKVAWLQNNDPHYPIEGGYKCGETAQMIAGPLL